MYVVVTEIHVTQYYIIITHVYMYMYIYMHIHVRVGICTCSWLLINKQYVCTQKHGEVSSSL